MRVTLLRSAEEKILLLLKHYAILQVFDTMHIIMLRPLIRLNWFVLFAKHIQM